MTDKNNYSDSNYTFGDFEITKETIDNLQPTATIMSAPATPPVIPQNYYYCTNACIASIGRMREPFYLGYHTAETIYQITNTGYISPTYGYAKKTYEDFIRFMRPADHYTTYSTSTITQTQYRNNIDAGHYIIGIGTFNNNANYHAIVMYNYSIHVGTFFAEIMEPYDMGGTPAQLRICSGEVLFLGLP